MLKLKIRHMLNPFHPAGSRELLELSPVVSEDNELIRAIEEAAEYDTWTLSSVPDSEKLQQFWNSVEDDIANDPEWVHFSE